MFGKNLLIRASLNIQSNLNIPRTATTVNRYWLPGVIIKPYYREDEKKSNFQ